MLIVRQCWVLFLYCGLFAGVYSIRYEEDSNTTVQSRQLQSGFFPSDFNQNGNYNGNSNLNSNNGNYNGNANYNTNSQYQGGNTLQFPSNDNQDFNPQYQNVQENSIFNTGEYYAGGDQQIQYQNNFNEVRPGQNPNRENNDVQYFAYQDQNQPTFSNTKPPINSYYQQNNPVPFQPNLQNPQPNRPFPVTQRPIGPFQRPQRPLGPVNNIPQPPGHYQQNYAGNFNNYQTTSSPISNFISNLGQGAADFFNGGPNTNYYNRPNGGPIRPQQFDSFNRPIRPNGNRPPPGAYNAPFGTIEQLGKAIDEITRNDDFQCIPKVICQMFGNQRQQSSYSSILGSPIFSGLIAAVPSSSTGLVYGRAALLGYTSGESSCNGAYPKCPKNEDDLLYYLNNHRGGFFRFFNGGATFGDDTNYNYNQNNQHNQNYNQNYNQQQSTAPQSTLSNLAALQNLAEVINQSDGINLSNIASNGGLLNNLAGLVGGNGGGTADLLSGLIGGNGGSSSGSGASGILNSFIGGGNGGGLGNSQSGSNSGAISLLSGLVQDTGSTPNIGSVVGNLLTGFIGNRFSSRKISKRSVPENDKSIMSNEEKSTENGENDNLKKESKNEFMIGGEINSTHDIEPRIVHGKLPILSVLNEQPTSHIEFIEDKENLPREEKQIKFITNSDNEPSSSIKFTDEPEKLFRKEKQIKFIDNQNDSKKSFFIFPSNNNKEHNENVIFPITNDAFRISKNIKFLSTESDPTHFFPSNNNHQSFNEINDTPQRIKMVFPDRTGTGNLIFDNNKFDPASLRIGKILTGLRVLQQLQTQQLNGNTNQILFDATNANRYGNSNYNANTLFGLIPSNDRYQQSLANRDATNQQANNHRFGNQNYNINYNSQSTYTGAHRGDDSSQNVYVTNGNGVVEYYINSSGVKVYV